MTAANGVPDVSTNPNSGYSLKITSHLVDVGVIVYDKHGHPVTDLKPEDFELYDEGQKQDIRFFSAARRPARGCRGSPRLPPRSPIAPRRPPVAAPPAVTPPGPSCSSTRATSPGPT